MNATTDGISLDAFLRELLPAKASKRKAALEAAKSVLDGLPALAVNQAQAARMLGCSRHTVRRLVEDGTLRPVSLRGLQRFPVRELEKLLGG